MLGFCRPAPGRAVSSCTLPAVRVPRISSRVFLVLPVLFLPSGFHGSSPGSSWVFLYSSCRQGSTDLSGLLGSSCTLPAVRVPRICPGSPCVFLYSSYRQCSTDLPPGLLGFASASLAVGFHGTPPGLVGSPSLVTMDQEISPRSAPVSPSCFGLQEST